jgi:hypothetical protein
VAPSRSTAVPVLVDGYHRLLCPQEGAHVAHRQRNLLLRPSRRPTWAFGARRTVSMATAYGCAGTSLSGRARIGVWQACTVVPPLRIIPIAETGKMPLSPHFEGAMPWSHLFGQLTRL